MIFSFFDTQALYREDRLSDRLYNEKPFFLDEKGFKGELVEGELVEGELVEGELVEGAPVEGAPVEGAPVEGAPVEGAPVEGEPVEGAPVEGAPVEGAPVEGEPVEGEPVEGEHVKGKRWKFKSNPIYCEMKDSYSLEDLVIIMIHSRHHFLENKEDCTSFFEHLQLVNTKLIDRITDELRPETITLVRGYTILFAYNLIVQIYDFTTIFNTSTFPPKHGEVIYKNIDKLSNLMVKLQKISNLPHVPREISQVIVACDTAIWKMKNVYQEVLHNDLKLLYTKILPIHCKDALNPSVIKGHETSFYQKFTSVRIIVDTIFVSSFHLGYWEVSPEINFDAFTYELSDAASNLKTFDDVNENSMMTSKNLVNFKYLVYMLEYRERYPGNFMPIEQNYESYRECRESAEICLYISLYPESTSDMIEYRLILEEFIVRFWERRNKRNEDGCILFSPEETEFIFHFVTQVFKSLRILPNQDAEHETLLVRYLKDYAIVLNSLRFQEIAFSISIKTAAILSNTVYELVSDAPWLSYHTNYNLSQDCTDLERITTRIIYYLCHKTKPMLILFESSGGCPPWLSKLKRIDCVTQIPEERRSAWEKALGSKRTAEDCHRVFNEKHCSVCRENLKSNDLCVFICMHTLCSSCPPQLLKNECGRNVCPICRAEIFEYIPGQQVGEIFKHLIIRSLADY